MTDRAIYERPRPACAKKSSDRRSRSCASRTRRFLTGSGRFIDDLSLPGRAALRDRALAACACAAFAHAHPRTGGRAVLTGADMERDGVRPDALRLGAARAWPSRRAMRSRATTVRHVGEPVAAVFAESRAQAEDAAERVEVDYEPLPLDRRRARAFTWTRGRSCAASARRRCARATRRSGALELVNNRLCGAAIETRGAASPPATRSTAARRRRITSAATSARSSASPKATLRVVSPDMGGGFGYKGKHYPEETLARLGGAPAAASGEMDRAPHANRFSRTRRAATIVTRAELALDDEGHFLALRVDTRADLGAYVSSFGAAIPGRSTARSSPACTRRRQCSCEVDRRLQQHRADRCLSRRRPAGGLLRARAPRRQGGARARHRSRRDPPPQPHSALGDAVQDAGRADLRLRRFPEGLARARACRFPGYAKKRSRPAAASASRATSNPPAWRRRASPARWARASASTRRRRCASRPTAASRRISARITTAKATPRPLRRSSRAQLGVPMRAITIVEGDTAAVPIGTGTFGSRSIAVGGSALHVRGTQDHREGQAHRGASARGCGGAISNSRDGAFTVAGTDRRVSFRRGGARSLCAAQLSARRARAGPRRERVLRSAELRLLATARMSARWRSIRDTGTVEIVGYWAVDDIGTVINPMIVEGQLHGGVAQGIGQALAERTVYEDGPAALGFVHGLCAAARGRPAVLRLRARREPALHAQPARRQGLRRVGHHRRAGGGDRARCSTRSRLYGVTDLEMPATPPCDLAGDNARNDPVRFPGTGSQSGEAGAALSASSSSSAR